MSKKHHHSKGKKNDRILKIIAVILAVVILVCGVLFGISLWERYAGEFKKQNADALQTSIREYNGKQYTYNEDIETILVMGLDKLDRPEDESYNNDMQADFIMLLVVDNKKEQVTALHINRDTIAQMNVLGVAGDRIGTVNQQIALAHTYGNGKEVSCRNTLEAVSGLLLGIEIDHYVSVTMDSVGVYNDLVGGVTIEVLDDFTGIDDTLIKGETVTLQGKQALNYVRTRYGLDDSSNDHRMKRQKQYIEALYAKTKECIDNDDTFIVNAASRLSSYIVSDCSANRLQELAEKVTGYEYVGIRDIEGESKMGETFVEFYPDAKSVEKTVIDLFYVPKD